MSRGSRKLEVQQTFDEKSALPPYDYVSPGFEVVCPDAAFPEMVVGDPRVSRWPWLRRWVQHNWYIDRRNPDAGFLNRDEAAILYNAACSVAGSSCLEIGSWRGWSTVHLALGCGMVDAVDPIFADESFFKALRGSCVAAGVLDKVAFHTGASPDAVDDLARITGRKWSLIFIDGDHEGEGPRLDAEAAMRHACDTAMVFFHDLASPYVARGIEAMRDAGWRTMIYQTTQIVGVAWRGNIEPPDHTPDPNVYWTLPAHLVGYRVSNWQPPVLRSSRGWDPERDETAWYSNAMMRAQAVEDTVGAILMVALDRSAQFEVRIADLSRELEQQRVQTRYYGARIAELKTEIQGVKKESEGVKRESESVKRESESVKREVQGLSTQIGMLTSMQLSRSAQDDLVHVLSSRRVLLGLMRLPVHARLKALHSYIETTNVPYEIRSGTLRWLSRRRVIFGLLRRSKRARADAVRSILNESPRRQIAMLTRNAAVSQAELQSDAHDYTSPEPQTEVGTVEGRTMQLNALVNESSIRSFSAWMTRSRTLLGLVRRIMLGRGKTVQSLVYQSLRDHGFPSGLAAAVVVPLSEPKTVLYLARKRILTRFDRIGTLVSALLREQIDRVVQLADGFLPTTPSKLPFLPAHNVTAKGKGGWKKTVVCGIDNAPEVSIIVPIYQDLRFVDSITTMQLIFEGKSVEWIFVCTDPTISSELTQYLLRRKSFFQQRTILLVTKEICGLSTVKSVGVEESYGKFILFMSSDIWLDSCAPIDIAIQNLNENRFSMIGFRLLYEDGTVRHDGIVFGRSSRWHNLLVVEHPRKGLPAFISRDNLVRPVEAVNSALMMIRRQVFVELANSRQDYLDNDLEDADLCLRASVAGHSIGLVVADGCRHLEGKSVPVVGQERIQRVMTYTECVMFNDIWQRYLSTR